MRPTTYVSVDSKIKVLLADIFTSVFVGNESVTIGQAGENGQDSTTSSFQTLRILNSLNHFRESFVKIFIVMWQFTH